MVKTIIIGKPKPINEQITCLECDSLVEYGISDIQFDGYKYFFGHKMNLETKYIICSNCTNPIFLDGKTRLPDRSKQVLHD